MKLTLDFNDFRNEITGVEVYSNEPPRSIAVTFCVARHSYNIDDDVVNSIKEGVSFDVDRVEYRPKDETNLEVIFIEKVENEKLE